MYKLETRIKADGQVGKAWRVFTPRNHKGTTFETEQDAWDYAATLDEDGYVPKALWRVTRVEGE